MRDYARIAPTFWVRGTGKLLRGDPEAQTLALFLMSAPAGGITGIFHLSLPQMCHETGLSLDAVNRVLARFATPELDFAFYDHATELVWVVNGVRHQLGEDTYALNDKRRVGIIRELKQVGSHPFVSRFVERYRDAYSLTESFGPPSTPPPPPSGRYPIALPPSETPTGGSAEGVDDDAATPSKGKRDPRPSLSLSISKSLSEGGVGETSLRESPLPTHQPPAVPSFGLIEAPAKPTKKSRAKKPELPLPEDFSVSAAIVGICQNEGLSNPHVVIHDFRDWAVERTQLRADWEATFRRWMRDPRTTRKHGAWNHALQSSVHRIAQPTPPPTPLTDTQRADVRRNVSEAMAKLNALTEPIPLDGEGDLWGLAGGAK